MIAQSLILCLIFEIIFVDGTQITNSVAERKRQHLSLMKIKRHVPSSLFLAPSLKLDDKATYNFAADLAVSASLSTLQCVYQQGYSSVFVQVYGPTNGGSVNNAGCQSVINAYSAKLGTEVYITPATSGKTGAQQFDEAYNAMQASGINIRSMWLQVTSPINWDINVQNNIALIQAFIARATSYGITTGIYTSWYDWQQITGAYTGFQTSARLWYWNALGQGPNAESQATFDDFRPFGGWNSPAVKQFALNENLCGMTLNRDVYPAGSKDETATVNNKFFKANAADDKPTVGGFV